MDDDFLKKGGIYIYENKKLNKMYIGQAVNLSNRLYDHHKNAYGASDYSGYDPKDGTIGMLRESPLSYNKTKLKIADMSQLQKGEYKKYYDQFSLYWSLENGSIYDFWEMICILYFRYKKKNLTNLNFGSQVTFSLKPNTAWIEKNLKKACNNIKGEKVTSEEYETLKKILTQEVHIGGFKTKVYDENSLIKIIVPALYQLAKHINNTIKEDIEAGYFIKTLCLKEKRYGENKNAFLQDVSEIVKNRYEKPFLKYLAVVQNLLKMQIHLKDSNLLIEKMSKEICKFLEELLLIFENRWSKAKGKTVGAMIGQATLSYALQKKDIKKITQIKNHFPKIHFPKIEIKNTWIQKDHWLYSYKQLKLEKVFKNITVDLKDTCTDWMTNIYTHSRKIFAHGSGNDVLYIKARNHFKEKCKLKEKDYFLKDFSDFYIYQETQYNIKSSFTPIGGKSTSDRVYVERGDGKKLSFTTDVWDKMKKAKEGKFKGIW